jgi:DNA helicase TIP49 (TBP-interacting protein)
METIYDLGTKMIEGTRAFFDSCSTLPRTHAHTMHAYTSRVLICFRAWLRCAAALDKEKVLSGDVIAIDKASGKISKLVRAVAHMQKRIASRLGQRVSGSARPRR